jgi:hypothetical protein
MGYSDDAIMANLTPDQATRMQAAVANYLMSVASNASTACGAQVPCNSYFYVYPDSTTLHHYFAVNTATGSGPLTYLWNWGDGSTDSVAYPSHVYDTAGYYNICLTVYDTTGCTSTYCDSTYYIQKSGNEVIYVDVIPTGSVGIQENQTEHHFLIYPNPADNSITVENISAIQSGSILTVYDIRGKLLYQQYIAMKKYVIDVSGFAKGVYVVKLKSENGTEIEKFIKD